MKELNDITLKEFQEMELFGADETFRAVVIIPMEDIHDSGYRCMKFALVRSGEIVGCVSGWSDVVHPNGIGNYGKNFSTDDVITGKVPKLGLSIDCLRESGCIRLLLDYPCKVEHFICSDFIFYRED